MRLIDVKPICEKLLANVDSGYVAVCIKDRMHYIIHKDREYFEFSLFPTLIPYRYHPLSANNHLASTDMNQDSLENERYTFKVITKQDIINHLKTSLLQNANMELDRQKSILSQVYERCQEDVGKYIEFSENTKGLLCGLAMDEDDYLYILLHVSGCFVLVATYEPYTIIDPDIIPLDYQLIKTISRCNVQLLVEKYHKRIDDTSTITLQFEIGDVKETDL